MNKNPSSLLFILDPIQEKVMLVNYVDSPFGSTKWGGVLYPFLTNSDYGELFFANFMTEFFLLAQSFYTNDDFIYIGDIRYVDNSFIDENGFINLLSFPDTKLTEVISDTLSIRNISNSKIKKSKLKAEDILKISSNSLKDFSDIPFNVNSITKNDQNKNNDLILNLETISDIFINGCNFNDLVKKFSIYVSINNDFSFLNRVHKNSDYIIKTFCYSELEKMHKDGILAQSTYDVCNFIFEHFRQLDIKLDEQ